MIPEASSICTPYKVKETSFNSQEIIELAKNLKYARLTKNFINGNYVDVKYNYDTVPFERIRRITGYLVGTLDRFNDAKKAEESQRIKHEI